MARVTVEDCVLQVPNRFELVTLAAQRAREISAGSPLTVDRDRDKNPVVSRREIAEQTVDLDALREGIVQSLQKHHASDSFEEDGQDEPRLALAGPGTSVSDAPAEDDLDLESLARELAAQAGDFKNTSRDE